jgi:prepilin-type N-terminal cleavage/methylation domain-containing protein
MKKLSISRGFTLIELLVVIAIISLISAVILASVNSARAKARDSRRLADINQLRNAFQLYFADNGSFPTASGARCLGATDAETCWSGYNHNAGGSGFSGSSALITALTPYMRSIPTDPNSSRTLGDRYIYSTGNLAWHCTNPSPPMTGPYLVWEPENTNPNSDRLCGAGAWACCGPLTCGSNYFCALKI